MARTMDIIEELGVSLVYAGQWRRTCILRA